MKQNENIQRPEHAVCPQRKERDVVKYADIDDMIFAHETYYVSSR